MYVLTVWNTLTMSDRHYSFTDLTEHLENASQRCTGTTGFASMSMSPQYELAFWRYSSWQPLFCNLDKNLVPRRCLPPHFGLFASWHHLYLHATLFLFPNLTRAFPSLIPTCIAIDLMYYPSDVLFARYLCLLNSRMYLLPLHSIFYVAYVF